jgi:hypothetical protein
MRAEASIKAGNAHAAVPVAERALTLVLKDPEIAAYNVAYSHAVRGQALALSGQRERGKRELLEARRIYVGVGESGTDGVKEVDALLTKLFGRSAIPR